MVTIGSDPRLALSSSNPDQQDGHVAERLLCLSMDKVIMKSDVLTKRVGNHREL